MSWYDDMTCCMHTMLYDVCLLYIVIVVWLVYMFVCFYMYIAWCIVECDYAKPQPAPCVPHGLTHTWGSNTLDLHRAALQCITTKSLPSLARWYIERCIVLVVRVDLARDSTGSRHSPYSIHYNNICIEMYRHIWIDIMIIIYDRFMSCCMFCNGLYSCIIDMHS